MSDSQETREGVAEEGVANEEQQLLLVQKEALRYQSLEELRSVSHSDVA